MTDTEIVMMGCNKITGTACTLLAAHFDVSTFHLVDENFDRSYGLKRDLDAMDLDIRFAAYDGISGVPPNVSVGVYAEHLGHSHVNATDNVIDAKKYVPYARSFSGVWITACDQVDTLNWFFSHYIPHEKCIGFGCQVDSARIDAYVRSMDPNLMAVVFGEHGGITVPVIRDSKFDPEKDSKCPVDDLWRDTIISRLSTEWYHSPGHPWLAKAFHLSNLVASVICEEDYSRWHPASVITDGAFLQEAYGFGEDVDGISIALSSRIDMSGVAEYDDPPMDEWEKKRMEAAMKAIDAQNKSILKEVE